MGYPRLEDDAASCFRNSHLVSDDGTSDIRDSKNDASWFRATVIHLTMERKSPRSTCSADKERCLDAIHSLRLWKAAETIPTSSFGIDRISETRRWCSIMVPQQSSV
eukprot:scaffold10687_cov116-Cylindrotheca_fusiformis.AAC.1